MKIKTIARAIIATVTFGVLTGCIVETRPHHHYHRAAVVYR